MRFERGPRARQRRWAFTQKDVANGHADFAQLQRAAQSPNWWVNPGNGVDYPVVVQTPAYRMDTPRSADEHADSFDATDETQLLSNRRADASAAYTAQVVNHYNVQPVYDVYANVQDRDLGGCREDVDQSAGRNSDPSCRPGSFFETRGQVGTMRASFTGMGYGLIFAILLVYFLMVVNFQSWTDPFIMLDGACRARWRESC